MEAEDSAELLYRAIEIGQTLVRIADNLGEGIAGNYLSSGLELLRARAERLSAHSNREPDQTRALVREVQEIAAAVGEVGRPADQSVPCEAIDPAKGGRGWNTRGDTSA